MYGLNAFVNGMNATDKIPMFAKMTNPGVFDFNSSALPMNVNIDLVCFAIAGT